MTKFIGQDFMLQTRYAYLEAADQQKGLPQPPLELAYDKTKPVIMLPLPESLPSQNVDLLELIELRTSVRSYQNKALSLHELSYLLWCTQGVKQVTPVATFRTVPSAGARHAFETYLLINQVEGVKPGLYRFLAIDHKLVEVNVAPNIADDIMATCLGQKFVKTSAVTFIWTAVAYRLKWRYGERAYRYMHLDAGHICQNLYLTAESVGCGVCAIAAFSDDHLNNVLGIDGEEQFAVYVATVGKKKEL
ncbi:MAG TPA: SagB/ThcOx family dehydrogenase [Negativicutes bacterium]